MEENNPTQETVDKLKLLNLTTNIHKLTPPQSQSDSPENQVAIINALKVDSHVKETMLQLAGYMLDPLQNQWVPYRKPIMNQLGIGNFIQTVSISKSIEYSNFHEKDISKYALHLYEMNYPYFTIYSSDYELDRNDFNIVSTLLFTYIITSLLKAKGAGHRNVARATVSEDLMGKFLTPEQRKKEGGGFLSILSRLNPLKTNKNG